MKKHLTYCFLLLISIHSTWANHTNPEDGIKTMEAIRTTVRPIVDGDIDAIFSSSSFKANDFTTVDPVPGLPSSYNTEVSVIYDDQAIFIAAKMYDDDIGNMLHDLSPRDQVNNSDYFGVTFDPYQTGISGFTFQVTAAGVQIDRKEDNDGGDRSWNDVWKSDVKIYEDYWVVEMAIPYSALRFPTGEINDWNIQFARSVRRTRELSYWNPVDPAKDGFLTQMGTLKNVKNIDAPLRLSVTPYVGLQLNTVQNANGSIGVSPKLAGGLDLKYGINEAFTLDMILIPDFSQVRSDVQVLNLGPFEVRFDENRPFFTEGLELFNTANIFYTRRIGGNGYLLQDLYNRGDRQSINKLPTNNFVNATKISGRTNTNTGVGFFNAVEIPTYAEYTDTSGNLQEVLINPLTNYNVAVVEQALKNNSKIAFINTNVTRVGEATDANVSAVEWNLRNKTEKYDFAGSFVSSQKFNPGNVDLGHSYKFGLGKIAGAWNYRAYHSTESANYDINDLGFLFSPNERNFGAEVIYKKFKPKLNNVAFWRIIANADYGRLFAPNVFTSMSVNLGGFLRLKSFDAFGMNIYANPVGFRDYFEPRTLDFTRYLEQDKSFGINGFISSDYRKPIALDVRWGYEKFDYNDRYFGTITVAPRFRLNSQIFIVPSISYNNTSNSRGYVSFNSEKAPELEFRKDIMIGERDLSSFNNSLQGQFNISAKMSFNLEVAHYFATVKYRTFNLLQENGTFTLYDYDDFNELTNKNDNDENFNFFTINAVYTWRFAPGSDLIVSYKSNLTKFTESQSYFTNVRNLGNFYESSGINIKALYFLDINRLRKK